MGELDSGVARVTDMFGVGRAGSQGKKRRTCEGLKPRRHDGITRYRHTSGVKRQSSNFESLISGLDPSLKKPLGGTRAS